MNIPTYSSLVIWGCSQRIQGIDPQSDDYCTDNMLWIGMVPNLSHGHYYDFHDHYDGKQFYRLIRHALFLLKLSLQNVLLHLGYFASTCYYSGYYQLGKNAHVIVSRINLRESVLCSSCQMKNSGTCQVLGHDCLIILDSPNTSTLFVVLCC